MENVGSQQIEKIASTALSVFSTVATAAKSSLAAYGVRMGVPVGAVNTWTDQNLIQAERRRDAERHKDLVTLAEEPAIARIAVVDESGRSSVYFVCRASPIHAPIAEGQLISYRAPMGRLASLPVGRDEDVKLPRGTVNFELAEKAVFRPRVSGGEWDSIDSLLHGSEYGPLTIGSLLALVRKIAPDVGSELLEVLLEEERRSRNIVEGIRRSVITKMGLRDQPILDQYQDAIFRLPLNRRLIIVGPPGALVCFWALVCVFVYLLRFP